MKLECPLCKQPFDSILHNVKASQEYDEYKVTIPDNGEQEQDVPVIRFYSIAVRRVIVHKCYML